MDGSFKDSSNSIHGVVGITRHDDTKKYIKYTCNMVKEMKQTPDICNMVKEMCNSADIRMDITPGPGCPGCFPWVPRVAMDS